MIDLSLTDLFSGLISLVIGFIQLLLIPIDNLILSVLPDLSNAFTGIGVLFNYIASSLSWVVSLTGLSSATLSLIVAYYTFKLTAPMLFYLIKLAIAWYNKLKL